jgi:hypothetical protein
MLVEQITLEIGCLLVERAGIQHGCRSEWHWRNRKEEYQITRKSESLYGHESLSQASCYDRRQFATCNQFFNQSFNRVLWPHKAFTILLLAIDTRFRVLCKSGDMKTKHASSSSSFNKPSAPVHPLLLCLGLAAMAAAVIGAIPNQRADLVAHEWGTFTSVQGSDGVLLDWRPLETSRLPGFVYDWKHPGLNRIPTGGQFPGKAFMVTLQRMETPVIYFYADHPQTVDVSVDFPKGVVTEWYPQAAQIGPASVPASPTITQMDELAHKAGAKPDFTFASFFDRPITKESRVHWSHLELLPQKAEESADLLRTLPSDRSRSHYFAARDTDSAYLKTSSLNATNPVAQHEKFLFYRGVGSFSTPLRVTMASTSTVTLSNTGEEPLQHLFLLSLHDKAGNFIELDRLAAGEQRTVEISHLQNSVTLLSARVAEALVSEGLFPREATAMVNTWKDSWFSEDGLRVLYTLPRLWTDRTLPITIKPAPSNLVRVMVGRAEILSPGLEQRLTDSLTKASQGDNQARAEAQAQLQKLGRFAEPAMVLATQRFTAEAKQTGWTVLQAAAGSQWE